jgi:glycosyltransferase involved in cell wall biosynthesis
VNNNGKYRFHVLGIPHTASNKFYSSCAFTQKVVNMCAMLRARGHTVYHYGNELSTVDCDEQIDVTSADDIGPPYRSGEFNQNSPVYMKFIENSIREIRARKLPNDFLLTFWTALRPVTDQFPDLAVVEAGIGYPSGHFAPFKVFESYAILHAFRGLDAVATANGNSWWYDVVIPNSYDVNDFKFSPVRGDYFLFMGMRANGSEGKGDYIAAQIARAAGLPLKMAGSGNYLGDQEGCEIVGFVNGEQRADLIAGARAVLTPSLFVEPFCGVHIEAMLSGTPVISTDWGAFAEYNVHGVTGYRCRNFEQFVWAAKNIDKISRRRCRDWARANFSLDRAASMYDEYWHMVWDVKTGRGWYEDRKRGDLDWLKRYNVTAEAPDVLLQRRRQNGNG